MSFKSTLYLQLYFFFQVNSLTLYLQNQFVRKHLQYIQKEFARNSTIIDVDLKQLFTMTKDIIIKFNHIKFLFSHK